MGMYVKSGYIWELSVYGHPNDMCGDDIDVLDDRFIGTRFEAQDEACRLMRDVYPGYQVRLSLVDDGFDFYDGWLAE